MRIGNMERKYVPKLTYISLILSIFIIIILSSCSGDTLFWGKGEENFDGGRAYNDILYLETIGPRIPGTEGHRKSLEWMEGELKSAGWDVRRQELLVKEKKVINLIAEKGKGAKKILLGAHYDTRIFADQDPVGSLQTHPVPGANDSASGVAVLLEIARILPSDLDLFLQIVLFDAEDNGGIEDWDWILGSRGYVENMTVIPDSVIIVDMVGDKDLMIYKEYNSDQLLMEAIWEHADGLGYGYVFQDEYKHSMLDDHTPFIEAGIPAVDIIDFDYPYWHTTADTADKVSPESLQIVGETLFTWLLSLD